MNFTKVCSFSTVDAAKTAAKELLSTGHEVAIIGPTPVVVLTDRDQPPQFWSLVDEGKLTLVIATKDGLDELP